MSGKKPRSLCRSHVDGDAVVLELAPPRQGTRQLPRPKLTVDEWTFSVTKSGKVDFLKGTRVYEHPQRRHPDSEQETDASESLRHHGEFRVDRHHGDRVKVVW